MAMNMNVNDMDKVSRTIHVGGVGGLGDEVKEADLAEFFTQYGTCNQECIGGSTVVPLRKTLEAGGLLLSYLTCAPVRTRQRDRVPCLIVTPLIKSRTMNSATLAFQSSLPYFVQGFFVCTGLQW